MYVCAAKSTVGTCHMQRAGKALTCNDPPELRPCVQSKDRSHKHSVLWYG